MIGPIITNTFTTNAPITTIIGDKLFPISDVGKGTPSVYYIVECIPNYNKGGQQMQDFRVVILTMDKTYKSSWELSLLIKEAFEKLHNTTVLGTKITKAQVTSIKDDYEFNINTYGQTIAITLKTQTIKTT